MYEEASQGQELGRELLPHYGWQYRAGMLIRGQLVCFRSQLIRTGVKVTAIRAENS